MSLLGLNDGQLAATLGWSRQKVQQRRVGDTRMRVGDIDEMAAALGVNPLVFSLEPIEALRWIIDNCSEQVVRSLRWFAASDAA